MANESRAEQIDRVKRIAAGDAQLWGDLSENDLAALSAALQDRADLYLALHNVLLAAELHGADSQQFFEARSNGLELIDLIANEFLDITNAAKAEGRDA